MALEEEQQHNEESHSCPENDVPLADSEAHSDDDQIDRESIQLNREQILNRTDLDKNLKMIKSLLHFTYSLQKDDTINMLTKVYRKCLELKKEQLSYIEFQADCYPRLFHSSSDSDQPMDL